MSTSHTKTLCLIVFLTAIQLQSYQAYPEPEDVKNEESHQELATDVQTLSQIEEENNQASEGDLKRLSRKASCPFSKLKAGTAKVGSIITSAVPCGASGTVLSGGGGGTIVSTGGADLHTGSEINLSGVSNSFEMFSDNLLNIGTALQGTLQSVQQLAQYMPVALANLRAEIETTNAPPVLVEEVRETCNNYVRAEKGINGIMSHLTNVFNIPSFKKSPVRYENFEIGGCLDNIKANMMNFLATIRSWFSCDKAFSSNKGIAKLKSFVEKIPTGAQCSMLNDLRKPNYYTVPYVRTGYYAPGGTVEANTQVNSIAVRNQLQQIQQLVTVINDLPSTLNLLIQELTSVLNSQTNSLNSVANVPTMQLSGFRTMHTPEVIRPVSVPHNIMTIRPPQQTVRTYVQVPAVKTNFYIAPRPSAVPISVPVPTFCSGQSIVDKVSNVVTTNPVIKQTESFVLSSSNGNINSRRSALDLLQVRVNLSRDTVYTLLSGQIPQPGDIIILNLTDDIMIVGSPSDDISPITFNFIYRGVSSRTRYNNNVFVWNISNDDFACNQDISNDILSHLVYSQ